MAIARPDATVAAMNEELRFLMAGNLPGAVDGFALRIVRRGHAVRSFRPNCPFTVVRDNMLITSTHSLGPYILPDDANPPIC